MGHLTCGVLDTRQNMYNNNNNNTKQRRRNMGVSFIIVTYARYT